MLCAAALLLLCALLFSPLFVLLEAHHECEQENCEICRTIDACLTRYKDLSAVLSVFLPMIGSLAALGAARSIAEPAHALRTPVAFKVKITS